MASAHVHGRDSLLLDRLDDVTVARISGACLYLLGDMSWIRRRSERITFHEYSTVRLSSTLDMAIPDAVIDLLELDRPHDPPEATDGRRKRRIVVPLDVLRKGPLVHFDLAVDGKSATLLSSQEVAPITASMLSQVAIDAGEGAADQEVFALLRRIGGLSARESVPAYDRLCAIRSLSPMLLTQARWFRDNYLMLAEITTEEHNLIVKYARDESLRPALTWHQRLGFELTSLDVPLGSMGRCGSYHAEAIVPGELKICGAQLTDTSGIPLPDSPGSQLTIKQSVDRASLYVRRPPPFGGRLIVKVATHRSVLLRPALVIALIATSALVAGGVLAIRDVFPDSLSGSAASPLYLALSIAAGLVLYRAEAPLVRVMLAQVRATLMVVAGTTLAGGALLAFGLREQELGRSWLGLSLITAGAASILGWAYRRAVPEVPSREQQSIRDHGD